MKYLSIYSLLIFYILTNNFLFAQSDLTKVKNKIEFKFNQAVENRKQINEILMLDFDSLSFQEAIFSDKLALKREKELSTLMSNSLKLISDLNELDSNHIFQGEKVINILSNEYMFRYKTSKLITKEPKALKQIPDNLYDEFYNTYLSHVLNKADQKSVVFTNSPSEYYCLSYLQVKKGLRKDVVVIYVPDLNKGEQYKVLVEPSEGNKLISSYDRNYFEKFKTYDIGIEKSRTKFISSDEMQKTLLAFDTTLRGESKLKIAGFKIGEGKLKISGYSGLMNLPFVEIMSFDLISNNPNYSIYLLKGLQKNYYQSIYNGLSNYSFNDGYTIKIKPNLDKHFMYYNLNVSQYHNLYKLLVATNLNDINYSFAQVNALQELSKSYSFLYKYQKTLFIKDSVLVVLDCFGKNIISTRSFPTNGEMVIDMFSFKTDETTLKIANASIKRLSSYRKTDFLAKLKSVMKDSQVNSIADILYENGSRDPDIFKVIQTDGKEGIATLNGTLILSPDYEWVSIPHLEKSIVSLGGKYGVVGMEGDILTPIVYDSIFRMENYLVNEFVLQKNGKMGVLFQGKITKEILPIEFDEIQYDNSIQKFLIVRKGKKYGVYQKTKEYGKYNIRNTKSLPCIFDSVRVKNHQGKEFLYAYENKIGKVLSSQFKLYDLKAFQVYLNGGMRDIRSLKQDGIVEMVKIERTEEVYNPNEIYDFTEQKAEFNGGVSKLDEYLSKNKVSPKEEKDIKGSVYVQFVVNKDGSISDVKILRGVTKLLDKEAIRLIQLMPNWIPGKHKGKTVRTRVTWPISF